MRREVGCGLVPFPSPLGLWCARPGCHILLQVRPSAPGPAGPGAQPSCFTNSSGGPMIQCIASSVPSLRLQGAILHGWSGEAGVGLSLRKTDSSFGSLGWLGFWVPSLPWWWKACSHAYSDCSSEKRSSQTSAWLWASGRQLCGAPVSTSSCTPLKLPSHLPSQNIEDLREAWVSPLPGQTSSPVGASGFPSGPGP